MENVKLENAVQKYDPVLDIVPVQVDARTVIEAGYSKESSLVKFCKERNVTVRELREMSALRDKYQTNLATLVHLRDKGCSIEELEQLLEVRESYGKYAPSLTKILEFKRQFGSGDDEVDSDYLVEMIRDAHEAAQSRYEGQSIDAVIETGEQLGICAEHACNWIKGIEDPNFSEDSIES